MNDLIVSDVLHNLDRRHEHLLTELDDLNLRVEQTLNSLNKPSASSESAAEEESDSAVTSDDQDGHSC
jgi:hypothetical protein